MTLPTVPIISADSGVEGKSSSISISIYRFYRYLSASKVLGTGGSNKHKYQLNSFMGFENNPNYVQFIHKNLTVSSINVRLEPLNTCKQALRKCFYKLHLSRVETDL